MLNVIDLIIAQKHSKNLPSRAASIILPNILAERVNSLRSYRLCLLCFLAMTASEMPCQKNRRTKYIRLISAWPIVINFAFSAYQILSVGRRSTYSISSPERREFFFLPKSMSNKPYLSKHSFLKEMFAPTK